VAKIAARSRRNATLPRAWSAYFDPGGGVRAIGSDFVVWDYSRRNCTALMTTMAAIDRLVHHAIILELTGPSLREEDAKAARRPADDPPPEASS
jgi:hypothetical protein